MLFENRWKQIALEIAEEIRANARYARDGQIYWLTSGAGPRPPLDSNLYPGTTGVALFFALASRVLERPSFGQLALKVLEPLRSELRRVSQKPGWMQNLQFRQGGFLGVGSWIYGLIRIGELLELPSLWDEALQLSALLSFGRFSRSTNFEVMTGTAGALLALLALEKRRPHENPGGETALDLALEAGQTLLAKSNLWLPSQDNSKRNIGFCHGATGILYSLLRLDQRINNSERSAAIGAIWESIGGLAALLTPASENHEPTPHTSTTWCNGSVGILLACLERPAERMGSRTLETSLKNLALAPLNQADHLCCGNMGRVDLLVHAADRLEKEALLQDAEQLAVKVLERARIEGHFRLMFYPKEVSDFRLFPGLTGVGYAFLRLASPRSLPTVLGLL